jgi:hypothetical protein
MEEDERPPLLEHLQMGFKGIQNGVDRFCDTTSKMMEDVDRKIASLSNGTRAIICATIFGGLATIFGTGLYIANKYDKERAMEKAPATSTPPEGGGVAPVKIEDADPASPMMPTSPEETSQQSLAVQENPGPSQ